VVYRGKGLLLDANGISLLSTGRGGKKIGEIAIQRLFQPGDDLGASISSSK
jgi:hypothetical protein